VTIPASHTHQAMAEYVLAPFTVEEEKLLAPLFGHVYDACLLWMNSGIQRTMNRYNKNFFSSAGAE
jgi:peptidyl-tRNA hydrolase